LKQLIHAHSLLFIARFVLLSARLMHFFALLLLVFAPQTSSKIKHQLSKFEHQWSIKMHGMSKDEQ